MVPEVQTADSCFGLIRRCQCTVALGGPATSTVCMANTSHDDCVTCMSLIVHVYGIIRTFVTIGANFVLA